MKKILTVCMLAYAVFLAGCGGKESSSSATNQYGLSTKNNFVWWQLSDVTTLIPYISHDASAPYVYQLIWEPLNSVDARTLESIPWMASLPEISEDHLTYTFTMNPKAKWSDGKPITGEDAIFSFKTVMNPALIDATSLRNYISALDSVYLVGGDKMKVAFRVNTPYFMMDRVLATGYVPILPKHIFDPKGLTDQMTWPGLKSEASNPVFKEFADWLTSKEVTRDPKYVVGSGPYLFKEWITFDRITLKKNPNYWAKDEGWGEAYLDEIIYKTINDPNAAVTALKAKDLDIMDQVPPPLFLTIDSTKQPFIKRDTVYVNQYAYLAWNKKRPVFQDKNVRLALGHLINKQEIIEQVLKGLARPVQSPIIFTQPDHNPNLPDIEFNPEKAKQLLAEAGWTDSDGNGVLDKTINGKKTPFEFTFSTNAGNEVRKQVLLIVSEQFRKAGIKAEVISLEWSVFLENLHSHNFDACYSSLGGNAGATNDLYQTWHSSQAKNKGSNWHSFINAEADALLASTRTEFDPAKRKQNMGRLQEIIHEEQPVSFLWATPLLLARVDRFDNVEWFRQRPGFSPQYWIVRGSGAQPIANRPSTIKQNM